VLLFSFFVLISFVLLFVLFCFVLFLFLYWFFLFLFCFVVQSKNRLKSINMDKIGFVNVLFFCLKKEIIS